MEFKDFLPLIGVALGAFLTFRVQTGLGDRQRRVQEHAAQRLVTSELLGKVHSLLVEAGTVIGWMGTLAYVDVDEHGEASPDEPGWTKDGETVHRCLHELSMLLFKVRLQFGSHSPVVQELEKLIEWLKLCRELANSNPFGMRHNGPDFAPQHANLMRAIEQYERLIQTVLDINPELLTAGKNVFRLATSPELDRRLRRQLRRPQPRSLPPSPPDSDSG